MARSFRGKRASILLVWLVGLHPAVVQADDIFWVGYQNDCMVGYPDTGSFFHGDNWYGYVDPGPFDTAIFGSGFDPQENGIWPRTIHFGDFCLEWFACSPNSFEADSAVIGSLNIAGETWTFDMGSGTAGTCDPPAPSQGSCTVLDRVDIGVGAGPASFTVRNGNFYSNTLLVGGFSGGHGSMFLEQSAVLRVGDAFEIGAGHAPAWGYLEVGPGCRLVREGCCDVSFGLGAGNEGTLRITGGEVEMGVGNHHVGRGGQGYLFITNAGSLHHTGNLVIAGEGGSGYAEVEDPGSSLFAGGVIDIGKLNGSGELVISEGSASCHVLVFATDDASTGSAEVDGGGTLSVVTEAYVGARGVGSVRVRDAGSSFEVGGFLFVGREDGAHGMLEVDAGSASTLAMDIGSYPGSEGEVHVGTGGFLLSTSGGNVGWGGTGTLDLQDGEVRYEETLFVGRDATGDGTVTIAGASGKLDGRWVVLAADGRADVTLRDGGTLDCDGLTLGLGFEGTATLSVGEPETNPGQVAVAGSMFVGDWSDGNVLVRNGTVTADHIRVAINPGADGNFEVQGAGSSVDVARFLTLGEGGSGFLRIADGAEVTAPQAVSAGSADGEGTAVIELATGTIHSPLVYLLPGGCLRGEGTIDGDLVSARGKVSPGTDDDRYGTIDVTGDVDLGSDDPGPPTTALAEFDISGPAPGKDHDKIRAQGAALFSGTLSINLTEGYVPSVGDSITLFEYGSAPSPLRGDDNDFDCFSGLDLGDSLSFLPLKGATAYVLVAGEPSGNGIPLALPDSAFTPADLPLTLDLVVNDSDPDGDDLSIVMVDTGGTTGTVTIESDFTIRYVPDPLALGIDTFTYFVTDCQGGTAAAVVTVEVGIATSLPEGVGRAVQNLSASPNPFAGSTEVRWTLQEERPVEISVHDVSGARVRTLVRGTYRAGDHLTLWHGDDEEGRPLSAGVYFLRSALGAEVQSRRVVLVK